jgi:hypothetical protein
VRTDCVKCGTDLEQPATGRPKIYCSVGCRRAAEFEIRRISKAIEATEADIRLYEGDLALNSEGYGNPAYKRKALRHARKQLEALERRFRTLLSDPEAKGDPR